MKKTIFILMALLLTLAINAQVMPTKFTDNISVIAKGGVSTPLNNLTGKTYGNFGLQVEKGINPWLSVAIDGETFIAQDIHTAFDAVNVNGLVKINLLNSLKIDSKSLEIKPFTGIGWGHNTCSDYLLYGHRNYMTFKAGSDFIYNITNTLGILLSPAIIYATPNSGKISKNNGLLELNAGVVYSFNKGFTKAKLYNQAEVDSLNSKINSLRSRVYNLNNKLRESQKKISTLKDSLLKVKIISNETLREVIILPKVQFEFNSALISKTSYSTLHELANIVKNDPDHTFVVTGYASNEGTEEYNKNLSYRRAETVANALMNLGVESKQLLVIGEGITNQFSVEDPSLNRVVILK